MSRNREMSKGQRPASPNLFKSVSGPSASVSPPTQIEDPSDIACQTAKMLVTARNFLSFELPEYIGFSKSMLTAEIIKKNVFLIDLLADKPISSESLTLLENQAKNNPAPIREYYFLACALCHLDALKVLTPYIEAHHPQVMPTKSYTCAATHVAFCSDAEKREDVLLNYFKKYQCKADPNKFSQILEALDECSPNLVPSQFKHN